jgi:Fe-S-cluster-containing hydrogenase component 2
MELHRVRDDMDALAAEVVATLERHGIPALNPATSYPMEMDNFPGKTWVVGHKPVAVAAGLGRMGIHRSVIHPVYGSFILLGTIIVGARVSEEGRPIDYNPCLECKLCVAVCPVGAISPEGEFHFSSCYTHNYREFKGGFTDWIETIADSKDAADYRKRISESETASMWQSLSSGANYKASYCIAVCPAGEDVIEPFMADRKAFLADVLQPLQKKVEPIYVTAGSDAELHVQRRFPHKRVRRVGSSLRVVSIDGFLLGITLKFQKNRAGDLAATYHFIFTGDQPAEATVVIRDGTIKVERALVGTPDVRITADSATWVRFARKETPMVLALLRRKVRVQGPLRLLKRFGKCFE